MIPWPQSISAIASAEARSARFWLAFESVTDNLII